MVSRFQGSGREKEGGFLATHKQDFNAHVTGGDFRHGAIDIDMEPVIPALGGATVQATLEQMSAFLAAQGTGFISIGKADGYDGYAAGVFNVGALATPTLTDAFNAAFADTRLQNGGVILVLAGTYELLTTVEVPPGITIMGELAGTIIIGHAIEQSMFKVLAGTENTRIGGDSGSGDLRLEAGEPLDVTTFWNLILADNLDGYVTSGGQPVSAMQTVPMIEGEVSSNLVCKDVRFIGRVNNGPVAGRPKTLQAIGGYTTGGGIQTHLELRRCFFDGMRIAADFSPGGGDIDHLIVDKCRARTFGTEVAFSPSDNCFIAMSLCNATLTNNNFVGFGTFPTQLVLNYFVVSSATGGSDVSVVVTGNTGSPSSGATSAESVYFNETAVTALKAVISGNNWSSNVNNHWFVTVGDGSSVFDGTYGDFVGSGAIDLVLAATFEYPTTIVVNGGTYEVTSAGNARYNFVGNNNASRPIFDMNLGAGAATDETGNRTFVMGERAEYIQFRSNTATTGTTSFHSIRPSSLGSKAIINNCEFVNCTLSIDDAVNEHIVISNCDFSQDGTFADNIGLLAPRAEHLLVEGCRWTGSGYAGLIGIVTSISYSITGAPAEGVVILRDCLMDLTGFTITDSLSYLHYYFRINGDDNAFAMKAYLENCQILANNTLTQITSTIGATPLPGFFAFVNVVAKDVYVDNCLIHGPTQAAGGGALPLPAFDILPGQSVRVTNSKFIDGGVPLRISGGHQDPFTSNLGIATTLGDSVVVDGCYFKATAAAISNTLLDIDLDPTSLPPSPRVVISNNNFSHPFTSASGTPVVVGHSDMRSSAYTQHGIVQIFALDFDISVHHNSIIGDLDAVMPASFDHVSGLVIQNFTDAAAADGTRIAPINVSNNRILVTNDFQSATVAETATALWMRGTDINVSNNHLAMDNDAGTNNSFIGCMYIENRDTATGGSASAAVVTGNTFSRRDVLGAAASLVRGYIIIPSTVEGDGTISDNVFSDPTINGSSTTTVEDNSSSVFWNKYRNKNQTDSIALSGVFGQSGVQAGASLSNITTSGQDVSSAWDDSTTEVDYNGSPVNFKFRYDDAASTINAQFVIPLFSVLPYGVEIIRYTATADVNATPTGVRTSDVRLTSSAGVDFTQTTNLTDSGFLHDQGEGAAGALTFSHRVTPSANPIIAIGVIISDAGAAIIYNLTDLTVVYRW